MLPSGILKSAEQKQTALIRSGNTNFSVVRLRRRVITKLLVLVQQFSKMGSRINKMK